MSITTTITVNGMSCAHCVRSVESEIGRIDGVTDVDVDLATGAVDIASDAPLDRSVVEAAVDEAGYEVEP